MAIGIRTAPQTPPKLGDFQSVFRSKSPTCGGARGAIIKQFLLLRHPLKALIQSISFFLIALPFKCY
jgi:hypothetical protein